MSSLVADWQRVTHRLLTALDESLADVGLSSGDVNALACFLDGDPHPVRELVHATGQRPSTLTGVLDRLESRGLIDRRANPADRRSVLVAPTAAGRLRVRMIELAFEEIEQRLTAEVPREQVRQLLDAAARAFP